jgi:hypothetical protein
MISPRRRRRAASIASIVTGNGLTNLPSLSDV